MSIGPGKYDALCTAAREAAQAQGVILIVLGGKYGQGFCCQLTQEIHQQVPAILRVVAAQIESDLKAIKNS
jgi:hypothetical protein